MKRARNVLVGISLMVAFGTLHAQDSYEKVNSNVGINISVPLNPTAQFVDGGWGITGGAGYNFSIHHAAIGEFMWNRLHPTNGAFQPFQGTMETQDVSGRSDLYALTGNYRFELPGKEFGTYFIGGGGWYHRTTNLSRPVLSGTSITCTPTWLWWGFTCSSGTVTANQSIASASETAFGINGGVGVTVRVGEAPYRFYFESRYHYAPTKNVSTQLIVISVGIRY